MRVLLDLGLSSMQVDRPERGFSYATDAPLDMRMDTSDEPSAADVLATYDERELETIFRRFGEERYARQIARGIVRRRAQEPIERTGQLVDVVRASIPAPARFGEGHPAKRVFQALRIEVNHELESLEAGLPPAFEMLRPGGRSPSSASTRSRTGSPSASCAIGRAGCTCPPELPVCVCGHEPELRILTPKPVRPSAREVDLTTRVRRRRGCGRRHASDVGDRTGGHVAAPGRAEDRPSDAGRGS